MQRIAEIDAEHTGARGALDDGRVIRGPRVAAVGRREDSGLRRAAGADPSPASPLSRNARAARRERRFSELRRRQPVADIRPGRAVGRVDHGKPAVDGVAHGDTVARGPEREAVIKCVRVQALELQRPGCSAILGLIDAGSRADARGQEIGDCCAHPLHIAELELFGPRNHARPPGCAAIGGDDIGAAHAAGPHHA